MRFDNWQEEAREAQDICGREAAYEVAGLLVAGFTAFALMQTRTPVDWPLHAFWSLAFAGIGYSLGGYICQRRHGKSRELIAANLLAAHKRRIPKRKEVRSRT